MFWIILSYIIGSISGSYLLGKIILQKDVRKYGSGNAGTTNAMRVFGKKIGIMTFCIDFLKGFLYILLLKHFTSINLESLYICSVLLIIGHDYPFYMSFKGGKGVATTIGAFAVLGFKLDLIAVVIWILSVYITKIVSLGSIIYFITVSTLFIGFMELNTIQIICVLIIGLLGIFRHKDNIYRMIHGKENKIGKKME